MIIMDLIIKRDNRLNGSKNGKENAHANTSRNENSFRIRAQASSVRKNQKQATGNDESENALGNPESEQPCEGSKVSHPYAKKTGYRKSAGKTQDLSKNLFPALRYPYRPGPERTDATKIPEQGIQHNEYRPKNQYPLLTPCAQIKHA